MNSIEEGNVICVAKNEWGFYTINSTYTVSNGFIKDDYGEMTNFSNVRKWFKKEICDLEDMN